MWNDGMLQPGMMDWSMAGAWGGGDWHWMFSIHGLISIFFIAVIIFAATALLRDWRGERRDDATNQRLVSRRRETNETAGKPNAGGHSEPFLPK